MRPWLRIAARNGGPLEARAPPLALRKPTAPLRVPLAQAAALAAGLARPMHGRYGRKCQAA